MELSFLGQPFPDVGQVGVVIAAALEKEDRSSLWIATAWGKRSGLSRMGRAIRTLQDRGGAAEVVLGVDEGGATEEGLELALELFDRAFVFHDPGARTFHPKVYVVQGDTAATAIVGSGNTTKGGLFTNFEASVVVELDEAAEADVAFLEQVRQYYDQLKGLTGFCRPLTEELIAELLEDPTVVVESEREANRKRASRRARTRESGESVFGSGAVPGLLGAPDPDLEPVPDEGEDDDDALQFAATDAVPTNGDGEAAPPAPAPWHAGFFKTLSNNDVSLVGAPGQIIIPIGYRSFFGDLQVQKDESATGGPRQEDDEFPATFRDADFEKHVSARVIVYVPAANHARQNTEVRFTLRDRQILTDRLSAGDVLVFTRSDGDVLVERRDPGWRPNGVPAKTRYGLL